MKIFPNLVNVLLMLIYKCLPFIEIFPQIWATMVLSVPNTSSFKNGILSERPCRWARWTLNVNKYVHLNIHLNFNINVHLIVGVNAHLVVHLNIHQRVIMVFIFKRNWINLGSNKKKFQTVEKVPGKEHIWLIYDWYRLVYIS